MKSVEVLYDLNLGPSVPDDYIDLARRQGEDPNLICAYLQELKDMIYGKCNLLSSTCFCFLHQHRA